MGPEERDGVEVSQERLMSSDQSGEPPLLQEEADPGPKSGGKDEAPLGSEGGSSGMVSEASFRLVSYVAKRLLLTRDLFAQYTPLSAG